MLWRVCGGRSSISWELPATCSTCWSSSTARSTSFSTRRSAPSSAWRSAGCSVDALGAAVGVCRRATTPPSAGGCAATTTTTTTAAAASRWPPRRSEVGRWPWPSARHLLWSTREASGASGSGSGATSRPSLSQQRLAAKDGRSWRDRSHVTGNSWNRRR